MQEEVTKHTKKIYSTIKDPRQSISRKLVDIGIEVLIIVFAVSLSIGLHSWIEHRHQQQEVSEFLADLHEDLKSDIDNISKSKAELFRKVADYQFVLGLTKTKIDSFQKNHITFEIKLSSNISTTKISNGNYEGFKSSGKIGYIENKKLKRLILKYYQERAPEFIESEKYNSQHFSEVLGFINNHMEQGLTQISVDPTFKQILNLHTSQSQGLLAEYTETLDDAKSIIAEINKLQKDTH